MSNKKTPSLVTDKPKPTWMLPYISCWDEKTKTFKMMTLEESTIQIINEWDCIDYCISSEVFKEDIIGIKSMMKKIGYYLIYGSTFQHYTRKKNSSLSLKS